MAMPRPENPLPTIATSTSVGSCSLVAAVNFLSSLACASNLRIRNLQYCNIDHTAMASPVAKPARMTAVERREQLLDVTKAIVAEHGFHAVSIKAVAREAGISRPIVYEHFGDLARLLEALINRESARALAQLAEVLPTDLAGGDPAKQLLAGLRGYLEAVRSDPVTWRLVLMPPEGAPKVLHDHITRGRTAVVEQL